MKVTNRQLAETLLAEISSGKSAKAATSSLVAYLVTERRTKDADAIIREVGGLLQSRQGQIELDVTTAHGLSSEIRQQIQDLFGQEAKNIIINEQQDPAVLGGVLVESNEQRLDLTVRRQIERLKGVSV